MNTTTLSDLARAEWRMMPDPDNCNEVDIVRPNKDHRGAWVGPLAKVFIGSTEQNDDDEEVLCLDGEDGAILNAIAAIPQFAEFVCFVRDSLDGFDGTFGKSQIPESPELFFKALRAKSDWLRELIDDREATMATEGVHGLARMP